MIALLVVLAVAVPEIPLQTAGQTQAPVCIEYCLAEEWAPAIDGTATEQIEAYKQGDDGTDTQPIQQEPSTDNAD